MKLQWTARAYEQLYSIVEYISKSSLQNAGAVYDRIHSAVLKLKDFPDMGIHPHNDRLLRTGYRMLIVEKFIVLYIADDTVVTIMGVVHGAQKYEHLFR